MESKERSVKRKILSTEEAQQQRISANCRERQRTKELNSAFALLRRIVPSLPSDKMSKIHTLRIATEYIKFLDIMNSDSCRACGCTIPIYEGCLQTTFNIWRGGNVCQPQCYQQTEFPINSNHMGSMDRSENWFPDKSVVQMPINHLKEECDRQEPNYSFAGDNYVVSFSSE